MGDGDPDEAGPELGHNVIKGWMIILAQHKIYKLAIASPKGIEGPDLIAMVNSGHPKPRAQLESEKDQKGVNKP